MDLDHNPVKKKQDSKMIAVQTAMYLVKGKKITIIPRGVSGESHTKTWHEHNDSSFRKSKIDA